MRMLNYQFIDFLLIILAVVFVVVILFDRSLATILLFFLIFYFLAYLRLGKQYEHQLKDIVPLVNGNVISHISILKSISVLNGTWSGRDISISVVNYDCYDYGEKDIELKFYVPLSNSIPMKVRNIKNSFGLSMTNQKDERWNKIKLEKENLEIIFRTSEESVIRNYLTPEKTQIIRNLLDKGYDTFEINKDDDHLSYLKLESRFKAIIFIKKYMQSAGLLKVEQIKDVLQNLNKFSIIQS